ncbi:MAG: hypothetical protein ACRDS1_12420, partial [Pseudonocardiaceae bacterium]
MGLVHGRLLPAGYVRFEGPHGHPPAWQLYQVRISGGYTRHYLRSDCASPDTPRPFHPWTRHPPPTG